MSRIYSSVVDHELDADVGFKCLRCNGWYSHSYLLSDCAPVAYIRVTSSALGDGRGRGLRDNVTRLIVNAGLRIS